MKLTRSMRYTKGSCMPSITIYSARTSAQENIITDQNSKQLTMYVCGVTPYDDAHIGHGRCYVTFDFWYRLLTIAGYTVTYCRNITDIDDKLLNRAEAELGDRLQYQSIAQRFAQRFQEDVARLGCLRPTHEPKATETIQEMIRIIETLIKKGHAYARGGDVYFRVASYQPYGSLSRQNIDALVAGARIAVDDEKESPLDFALWKSESENTFWKSPWGWGRPGWHIECSAMAHRYLGNPIDIHGGGMDLLFPHHENERAQSESCFGAPFVRHWIHNAFVRVKQEKMSKSLGNFVTLRAAFEQVDPMVLRYYYLMNHYRNPLDFSWDDIAATQKSYQRLIQWYGDVDISHLQSHDARIAAFADMDSGKHGEIAQNLVRYLCADANIQGFCGVLFEQKQELAQSALKPFVALLLKEVCGFSLQPLPQATIEITPEIQALLDARAQARAAGDWKTADAIRAQLIALNVSIQDGKTPKS